MGMSGRSAALGHALFAAALLSAILLPARLSAQDQEHPVAALEDRIAELSLEARYAEAVVAAKTLLALTRENPESKPFEIADAERLVSTLESAVSLPQDAREELALADSLTAVVEERWEEGNYAEGAEAAERQVQIRRKLLGQEHVLVAQSLNNLAALHWVQGDYVGAESLYREVLTMSRKLLGEEHPDVALSINSLALALHQQGDLDSAESLYREALAMNRRLLGEEHPDVALSLNTLANVLYDQGDFSGAEPLYRKALAMNKKLLGEEHANVAMGLNNMAVLLHKMGDYAGAAPYYREALAMRKKLLGEEHPAVAQSLNNLAALLWAQGDYDGAEPLYRAALDLRRKRLGDEHPAVATSLNNIALLLKAQGDYAGAEPLYREALAMWRKLLGDEHRRVATGLNNLASVLEAQGDYAQAESLYREALAIKKKLLGEEHPDVSRGLKNLANLLRDRSEFGAAQPLYERALAVYEQTLGPDHPEVADFHGSYAAYFQGLDDYLAAFDEHRESLRIYQLTLENIASASSERQCLLYNRRLQRALSGLIDNTVLALDHPEIVEPAYLELLHVRGALLDRIASQKKMAIEGAAMGKTYARLVRAKERLAFHVTKGPKDDLEAYQARLRELQSQREEMEREVALANTRVRERMLLEAREKTLDARQIYGLLPEGSVLVEWVRYAHSEPGRGKETEDFDAAFLADPRKRLLRLIPIGPATRTDSLIGEYQAHFARVLARGDHPDSWAEKEMKSIGRALHDHLIAPLGEAFASADLRLMVPDGPLALVNFATFVDPEGKYLIERAPIHILSSAKDLLRLETPAGGRGFFALGNPDYWASADTRQQVMAGRTPEGRQSSETAEELVLALRGERSGCGLVSNIQVSPLPGSEAEVKDIADLVRDEGWKEVAVITGAGATEDHLKRHAPGHRVVHLATHGFYLNGVCESAMSWRAASPSTDEKRGYVGENPMLLSGLLVSGSNRHGEGTQEIGIDDGILTATELASVDLSGCDWLVLSACETALGEVEQGEGVFGLRRAAQLAGARTVIMSVFPVPDLETRELMTVLYRERLAGKSTVESLQQAMRTMMARAEEKSGCRHPIYWGGFVAAGGWD